MKAIGLIAMFIDHVGMIFFPNMIFLRILGRIAYPVFLHFLYVGVQKTRDISLYYQRILICGIAYQIASDSDSLCCLFGFLLYVNFSTSTSNISRVVYFLLSWYLPVDYQYLVFFSPLSLNFQVANCLIMFTHQYGICQGFTSIFSIFISLYGVGNCNIPSKSRFFYFFYPIHIFLLKAIQRL